MPIVEMSGGSPEPPRPALDAAGRLELLHSIPADGERFQFRRLYEVKATTADRGEGFSGGSGQFAFHFGMGPVVNSFAREQKRRRRIGQPAADDWINSDAARGLGSVHGVSRPRSGNARPGDGAARTKATAQRQSPNFRRWDCSPLPASLLRIGLAVITRLPPPMRHWQTRS